MFGACFTCMKTAGADLFVQTYVEKKEWEDVDFRRTATFAVFGFGYMGTPIARMLTRMLRNTKLALRARTQVFVSIFCTFISWQDDGFRTREHTLQNLFVKR